MIYVESFFLIFSSLFYYGNTAKIGEACTISISESPGICKLGSDCPVVEQDAKQGIDPTLCEFYELIRPVVCCPIDEFSKDKDNITMVKPQSLLLPDRHTKRLCEKKCDDYYPPITSVPVPQVYNGKPAKPKEFPHMAAIGYGEMNEKQWACAGALISEKYILTAAHCMKSRELGQARYVRLGVSNILNVSLNDVPPQDFNIRRLIPHPKYRTSSKYHDIALIELDGFVRRSKYVNIACLNTERTHTGTKLFIAGWGQTEYAGTTTGFLLQARVAITDNQKCNLNYKDEVKLPNGIIDDWMICAGGESDTCNGDSGGPLMTNNTKFDDPVNQRVFNIIGITSFGRACGIGGFPGVYTRVYNYLSWIEETVWPNQA